MILCCPFVVRVLYTFSHVICDLWLAIDYREDTRITPMREAVEFECAYRWMLPVLENLLAFPLRSRVDSDALLQVLLPDPPSPVKSRCHPSLYLQPCEGPCLMALVLARDLSLWTRFDTASLRVPRRIGRAESGWRIGNSHSTAAIKQAKQQSMLYERE